MAMNTQRQLGINSGNGAKSIEKLSSGYRINRAGDDAAGLAISEKMRAQVRGLNQASRNAQDAISLVQTAEGALGETQAILQRMRELANQAANDTNVDQDRSEIQKEINQLTSEINRIGNTTEFNTQKLLNGGDGKTGSVRYSIDTQGAEGVTSTGDLSAVTELQSSTKGGTITVGGVTENVASRAGVPYTVGVVSSVNETVESVKAGTGTISEFKVTTESKQTADAATIGSPLTEERASVKAGTAEIQKSENQEGTDVSAVDPGDVTAYTKEAAGTKATFTIDFKGDFADAVEGSQLEVKFGNESVKFTAGADEEATIEALRTAMAADAASWTNVDAAGFTRSGTEITVTGTADATAIVKGSLDTSALADATAVEGEIDSKGKAAVYSFEVLENFTEGDTIEINGTTYTAGATGVASTGTTFEVKGTIAETVDELVGRVAANVGAGYTVTNDSPTFGAADENSITITADAAGNDLNKPGFTTDLTVTKTDAVYGQYQFELNTNAEVGSTITIAGQKFTAVAENGGADNTATTFEVGATLTDTVDNLKAAVQANTTLNSKFYTGTLDDGVTGAATSADDVTGTGLKVDADTLVFVEKNPKGDAMAVAFGDVTSDPQTEQAGVYTFDVNQNFSIGDKITIGGQEFTAGTANSGSTFKVGGDSAATADNLRQAIDANATLAARFDAAAVVAGTQGNNRITLTETATKATGTDLSEPTVASVAEVVGKSNFDITTDFTAGEKIDIAGQTFEAVAGTADATKGQFSIDGNIDATAASLKLALEANTTVNDQYTIANVGSNLEFTEKADKATGAAVSVGSTQAAGGAKGEYEFELTENATLGDKISIGGVELTAVASGAVADSDTFNIGATKEETVKNIVDAINNDTTLKAQFDASVKVDPSAPLEASTIVLKEDSATGNATVTVSATKETEQLGVYTVDVDKNFDVGDKVKIGDVVFEAGTSNSATSFEVGATAEDTAANIKDAINLSSLNTRFVATQTGDTIALAEKNGEATGVALIDPVEDGAATQGEFSFSTQALSTGSSMTIDGEKLTFAAGGDEAATATELKSLIEANGNLNSKYSVSVSDSEITLTQKAGQESADKPTVSYEVIAGAGFNATMQIGANTGQSTAIEIGDVRAGSLDVGSSTAPTNQTVEVDGKEFTVAWTSDKTVTNGTENVGTEYALDVSNHDNATAAVEVINNAINKVSTERAKLGAVQNRLEHTIKNLDTSSENLVAAESRIRDVDMAKEMMEFTKNNILQQAAQSMLAQANQAPQGVLQLLR